MAQQDEMYVSQFEMASFFHPAAWDAFSMDVNSPFSFPNQGFDWDLVTNVFPNGDETANVVSLDAETVVEACRPTHDSSKPKRFCSLHPFSKSRTRRVLNRVKGNNPTGKVGKLICDHCRKRRSKVPNFFRI